MKFEPYTIAGYVARTHSIKGEIIVKISLQQDFDPTQPVLIMIDGLPVPFFIEKNSLKYRNENEIQLLLRGIASDKEASKLTSLPFCVFNHAIESDDDELYYDQLVGYDVLDTKLGNIGKITQFIDINLNPLFEIEYGGKLLLFPAADDFILEIDEENSIVRVDLPDGIFEAQE